MVGVISIVSGKGGVGKTTFSINLAAALKEFNHESIIIDADVANPNVALHLNLSHMPLTIQDVLDDAAEILHAIQVHYSGLKVIPASFSMEKIKADFSKLKKVLKKLDDSVIIDSPPGINQDIIHILEASDRVIVVTNPEASAVIDAVKTIKAAKNLGKHDIGVVINRVRGDSYELTRDEVELMCEVPILGIIPEDQNLRKATFENLSIIHRNPYSNASIQFKHLAAKLLKKEYIPPKFLFLRGLLNRG
jgi:septum site-determining protein MinD